MQRSVEEFDNVRRQVMCDHENDALGVELPEDLLQERCPGRLLQVRHWLVKAGDLGLVQQEPGQGDPGLLPGTQDHVPILHRVQ